MHHDQISVQHSIIKQLFIARNEDIDSYRECGPSTLASSLSVQVRVDDPSTNQGNTVAQEIIKRPTNKYQQIVFPKVPRIPITCNCL